MKQQKKFFAVSLTILVGVAATIGFTIFNLSNTVKDLSVEISRGKADAILASAEIGNAAVVRVPILYYDQVMDECVDLYDARKAQAAGARQFEWASCGYYNSMIETGLTEATLNKEFLPVAVEGAGKLLSNRGIDDGFLRWFSTVEGKSKNYAGTIGLKYEAETASFKYEDEEFYPLNDVSVPAESVNADGNNHLFSLNLGVPFQVLMDGREQFEITADDDTWVYVGDKIVIDMGGIHAPTTGRFTISENGEIYAEVEDGGMAYSGVRVEAGAGTIVRIFHADRNSTESVFKIRFSNMLLNITNTNLAAEDGAQVAYDPENPSYIAPLGESLTVRPDKSHAILVAAIAQVSILGALMVLFVVATSVVWKYAHRDRSPEE